MPKPNKKFSYQGSFEFIARQETVARIPSDQIKCVRYIGRDAKGEPNFIGSLFTVEDGCVAEDNGDIYIGGISPIRIYFSKGMVEQIIDEKGTVIFSNV